MRISDWISDVCSSDLQRDRRHLAAGNKAAHQHRDDDQMPETRRRIGARRPQREPGEGDRDARQVKDRKSVVSGKRVSVRVDLDGRLLIKKQNTYKTS